jgi:hypothetical protein
LAPCTGWPHVSVIVTVAVKLEKPPEIVRGDVAKVPT